MMVSPSIDDLLCKVEYSRYILVTLASKRARELNEGSKPLVPADGKKMVSIALEEIYEGKIHPLIEREGVK